MEAAAAPVALAGHRRPPQHHPDPHYPAAGPDPPHHHHQHAVAESGRRPHRSVRQSVSLRITSFIRRSIHPTRPNPPPPQHPPCSAAVPTASPFVWAGPGMDPALLLPSTHIRGRARGLFAVRVISTYVHTWPVNFGAACESLPSNLTHTVCILFKPMAQSPAAYLDPASLKYALPEVSSPRHTEVRNGTEQWAHAHIYR